MAIVGLVTNPIKTLETKCVPFRLTLSVEHLFGWKGCRGELGVHGKGNWVQMLGFNSRDWQVTIEERYGQRS